MAKLESVENTGYQADLNLASQAASGDITAQRRLVDRLLDRTAITVRYITGNSPDSEDYVQQSIIKILQSIGSFRGESSLETWAERITVRLTMRQIKKFRWRSQFMTDKEPPDQGNESTSGETSLNRRRISEQLATLLWKLPEKRRLVVTLRLVMGHSIREIMEFTGLGENTVRDRIALGRKQLRRQIRKDPVLKEYLGTI